MTTMEVHEPVSVLELVDQLEDVVTAARRLPLSANVVVNEDETLELVDRIRLGLPDELVQARHTLEDRERIIATAEEEAERTLRHAEEEAERLLRESGDRAAALVAEHAVTAQARAHADALVAEAEERASVTRAEADTYARDVMLRLEEHLMRAVTTVRKGIETLPVPPDARRRERRERR